MTSQGKWPIHPTYQLEGLVFICRENRGRSGILLFLETPRFCLLSGMARNKSGKSGRVPEFLRWSAQTLPTSDIKSLKFVLSGTSGNDGYVSSRLCWCEQPNHYHDSFTFNHLHLQVPCTQMKCLTSQPVTSSYLSGAPNVNFRKIKISVRKTI